MANRQGYFATIEGADIAKELFARVDEYYTDLETSGYLSVIRKSYRAYFGSSGTSYDSGSLFDSSEIRRTGEQGELHRIKVNHFRNLIQHVLVLTTNPRPAMQARATNSDYKSQAQTILADGILEYYMREKRIERYLKEATEFALIFGSGHLSLQWDATAGDEYGVDPESGDQVNTGDLKIGSHTPLDIVIDIHKDSDDHDWQILREYGNKYDLMAKYPEIADEIEKIPTKDDQINRYSFSSKQRTFDSSDVPLYTFYHRKSDALPQGRMVQFLSDEVVLYDGPLPYETIPLYRIVPSEFHGSPYGYSQAFDLLAIQEGIDTLYSSVITNNITFATQNIWMPRGANVNVTHLAGGLNLIESDATLGKPEPMQMTASAPETYKLIETLERQAETLAGINSVVRGNPEASLKSGAALALVASQAIQFNSGLQSSFVSLLEDVGTGIINILKEYASVPRIAHIAGKHNRPYMKEFTGSDLESINRVTVEVGSAVSRTMAGRVEIANTLLQNGLVKTPDEYLSVIQTGKLDPMIEGATAEILLIKSENERLRDGVGVPAIATENHGMHITEHKSVLANPESKENPEIVQVTLDHINEHIRLLRETDPGLLQMTGQQPLAPIQPPMPPQGAPSKPPSPSNLEAMPEAMQTTNPIEAQMPNMPNMPVNPLTGETYTPEGSM